MSMELGIKGNGLTPSDKCQLGAQFTNNARKQATKAKIIEAVAYLKTSGKRVSIGAVATVSGLSKSGLVRNYGDFIRSL